MKAKLEAARKQFALIEQRLRATEWVAGNFESAIGGVKLFLQEAENHTGLLSMLVQARREIYLAHSKDGVVYDPTILTRIDNQIARATGKPYRVGSWQF
ncbi:hypothetical protein M0R72_07465 [Candidatus Pacearchaeota archaeon]|jgi:hypothetical protein|nr:hypothetical protein [Candidatus Pacearchaeota archaeon]